tara:strand:+ start:548 stop:649 length:102 start_codon:yes stop_codon:yes gene_type:complete
MLPISDIGNTPKEKKEPKKRKPLLYPLKGYITT